jgi:hypothetical protein
VLVGFILQRLERFESLLYRERRIIPLMFDKYHPEVQCSHHAMGPRSNDHPSHPIKDMPHVPKSEFNLLVEVAAFW